MRGRWPSRPSVARLSWLRQMTGMFNSRATPLHAREISVICCWRFSGPGLSMSCM